MSSVLRETEKQINRTWKIVRDEKRLLKYYPRRINIRSIGFTFANGTTQVFQNPNLDKKALQRILKGFLRVSEEQTIINPTGFQERTEIREKYVNLGNSNIVMLEIRYTITKS